ncbi:MAG TPA: asparaginase domain-containing protein [Verrucomicrobiae bacterium]|nr:asparaginase domain-containing protein [Verrucomicrobiae bacterium]
MPASNSIEQIRLLITGGTIDKSYCPVDGQLSFSRTHVLAMLKQARVSLPEEQVQTLLLKDSLDLTDADREAICQAATAATETKLIITHGTDTMVQTAQGLAAKQLGKTIVLVGAMVPYTFSNSDGLFNLGLAFGAVQLLPPGVYIAMNGRMFSWNAVRKNTAAGVFESIPVPKP